MRARMMVPLAMALALLCSTMIVAQDKAGPMTTKVPTNTARASILTTAKNDSVMALFVKHVNKAGLGSTLDAKGPYTVFAPTNSGFNARTKEDIDAEHADTAVLNSTMRYHILSGKALTTSDLMNMNGQMLTMDNGMQLPVMVQGQVIRVGTATLSGSDILATNGVIHEVDHVLIPGKEMPMGTPVPMGK
ncbi:MAG TPA: fasciclin domain-containing protein [bacterium]